MADLPSRIVIREEAFEDELHVLIRNPELADDYTAAAEMILATDATAGVPFSDDLEVWTFPLAPVNGKTVWLLYSFDAEAVVLLSLRLI
ncbi:MAG: hypothetical protein WDN28_22910 [Chthoniobacter sp.]